MTKKKVITVDFDETLAKTHNVWDPKSPWGHGHLEGGTLTPIKEIFEIVFDHSKKGYDIWIVTFRLLKDTGEVEQFVKDHNLPIKGIISTGGKSKLPHLQELGSLLHIDDNPNVIVEAFESGINGILVAHHDE